MSSLPPDPESRITHLEIRVMELQHDVESLSDVLLEQRKELDQLQRVLIRFEARLETMGEAEPPRDPAAERPPHY